MADLEDQLKNQIGRLDPLNKMRLAPADIKIIIQALGEMSQTLQKVSLQEINHNHTMRENDNYQMEISQLKQSIEKLRDQNSKFQSDISQLFQKIKNEEATALLATQKSIKDRKIIEELSLKLARSEKRVQLILETNIMGQREKFQSTLQELISENENLKKTIFEQEKHIEKITSNNQYLSQKIQRLNKKLLNMNIQKDVVQSSDFYDEEKMAITFTKVPCDFRFRYILLSSEFREQAAFLNTIGEQTAEEFFQLLNENSEGKNQQMIWLYNQLVNQKEFNEKHNYFLIKMIELSQLESIEEIQIFLRSLEEFFRFSEINLWMSDHLRQPAYWNAKVQMVNLKKLLLQKVYLKNVSIRERLKIVFIHSLIYEALTHQKNILYQSIEQNGQDIQGNRTYIYPLLTKTSKPSGLIEFARLSDQYNNFNSDVQYFSAILGSFTCEAIDRIEDKRSLEQTLKFRDLITDEFLKVCESTTKKTFVIKLKEMQKRVFLLSQSDFVFVQSELLSKDIRKYKMWKFLENGEIKEVDDLAGVSGQVIRNKRAGFFLNVAKEANFNSQIDMQSLLPVYIYPIFDEKEIIVGLIQISLTKKILKRHRYKDVELSLQSSQNEAKIFCEFISTAFRLLQQHLK